VGASPVSPPLLSQPFFLLLLWFLSYCFLISSVFISAACQCFSPFVSFFVLLPFFQFFPVPLLFLYPFLNPSRSQSILLCLSPSFSLTSSFYTLPPPPPPLCIKFSLPPFSLSFFSAVSLLPLPPSFSLSLSLSLSLSPCVYWC